MKIQITFTYKGVKYRKTIKDDETEMVFEVTADKKCVNDEYGLYVICGEGIYINVYPNCYRDDYVEQINADEIEVLYT